MSIATIVDGRIWLHSYDVSGAVNEVQLGLTAEAVECTNMNSQGAKEYKAGLLMADWNAKGFYDPSTSEAAAEALKGTVATYAFATDDAINSRCYFGQGPVLGVNRGFPLGQMASIEVMGKGNGTSCMVRGELLLPKLTATASANGAGSQAGAVGASEYAYGLLQVFSASAGDTLDVKIQSDDNSGFTSATDRITFTQVAGAVVGSELKSLAGAITDTYWRAVYTIAGNGSESFTFGVSFGIQ